MQDQADSHTGDVLYFSTKIIIYLFFVEKVVNSCPKCVVMYERADIGAQRVVRNPLTPRLKDKIYLFNYCLMTGKLYTIVLLLDWKLTVI